MKTPKKDKQTFTEPISVLLVEDNTLDLKVLQKMLNDLASITEIQTAKTLKDALKVLKKSKIDVVVLDLNLPDSTGADTLIKLNESHSDVAIVVNTGAYEDDLGLKTMALGAQDFIVKSKYKAYGLDKALHYAKERKRFELELRAAYTRLQETQAHLMQAEKMNVVGRLASGVAHEVKNPLATILFGITYLNEKITSKNEKIQLTLKSIKDAANRANVIITDLLDFSSLSRLKKKDGDINKILEKTIELTKHEVKKSFIKIKSEFAKNLPKVSIDDNRLEQVFVNLVLNAVHAIGESGEITLKTRSLKISKTRKTDLEKKLHDIADGTEVIVAEVEDNGAGIPDDTAAHIFDPFYTTKRSSGGVGLGLSVAKNIIDMHEGKIYLENRKEGGTRASVILKAV